MKEVMETREICARLRAHALIAKDKELCSERTVRAIEEAAKILDEDRWISVDERYPEDDDYILLSFVNFTVPQVGRYEDNNFFLGDEDVPLISQDLYVNAWRKIRRYDE